MTDNDAYELARVARVDAERAAEYEAAKKAHRGWLWGPGETGRTISAHGRTFEELHGE